MSTTTTDAAPSVYALMAAIAQQVYDAADEIRAAASTADAFTDPVDHDTWEARYAAATS
jgi:hypothetical protein